MSWCTYELPFQGKPRLLPQERGGGLNISSCLLIPKFASQEVAACKGLCDCPWTDELLYTHDQVRHYKSLPPIRRRGFPNMQTGCGTEQCQSAPIDQPRTKGMQPPHYDDATGVQKSGKQLVLDAEETAVRNSAAPCW